MVLYSEYSINKNRHNSKNKKYIINIYFLVAIIMISIFTISALSVLNYSINYDYKINATNTDNNNSITILNLEIQKNNSCEYCRDLINIINLEYEKYGKTIEDIVDIIKNICTFIHAPIVSQECVFISNNIEKILNWTSSGMNSTLICQKLNLCNYSSKIISS